MSQAMITLIILILAIVLLLLDKLPMGLIVFMVPMALYFTGIIDAKEIFASVVNPNVILILGMCVIGAAFFKTGLAYMTSEFLLRFTKSEKGLMVLVFMIGGIISGFVSNSGTVAILIPIVLGIAKNGKISPIKLLLPLVFGATIGADISIIGSPGNLIAKNTIEELSKGTMKVGFFEYAKIGIPLLLGTSVFLYFFGSKVIPNRETADEKVEGLDYSDISVWHRRLLLCLSLQC